MCLLCLCPKDTIGYLITSSNILILIRFLVGTVVLYDGVWLISICTASVAVCCSVGVGQYMRVAWVGLAFLIS